MPTLSKSKYTLACQCQKALWLRTNKPEVETKDAALEARFAAGNDIGDLANQSAEQIWVYVALEMAVNLQADAHAHRLQPVEEKIQELNQLIINTLQNNTSKD